MHKPLIVQWVLVGGLRYDFVTLRSLHRSYGINNNQCRSYKQSTHNHQPKIMATPESETEDHALKADASYESIFKQFKKFIDQKYPPLGSEQRTVQEYLTIENVTAYYTEAVKVSKNTSKTVARIKCGIQWFINRAFETVPSSLFKVENVPGYRDAVAYSGHQMLTQTRLSRLCN